MHVSLKTELCDEIHAFARLGFTDHGQGHIALGTQFGNRLQKIGETLESNICRRGGDQAARDTSYMFKGAKQIGINPNRDQTHLVFTDPHIGMDVINGVF